MPYCTERSRLRNSVISLLIIAALGFAVYANSLGGKFLWDDDLLVKDNLYIRNWSHISKIFSGNIGAGAMVKFPSYRPLQILTYVIDHSLWKANPSGYHLTNILFHISAALCIFWLINILFGNNLLSLLTAALFVVHPIHTEAVSYISGRADPMALTFMLLAFVFYVKSIPVIARPNEIRPKQSKNEIASSHNTKNKMLLAMTAMIFFYTLALLSRENSLILLLLIPLYHYTFKKKFSIRQMMPLLTISALYILFRLTALRSILFDKACEAPFIDRLPGAFAALTNYIKLLFLPLRLHMEYGYRQFHFSDPPVLCGIALFALLIYYIWKTKEKNKIVFFGLAWFLVGLLPVSNLYPINAYMAEHWLYLPSVGVFLVVAGAFNLVISNQVKKVKLANLTWLDITRLAITALVIALIAFYSSLTIRQNTHWRDPATFYEYTLQYLERNYRMLNNLAKVYDEMGRPNDAIVLYKKAVEAEPKSPDVYYNLGNTYARIGNKEMAIESYKKSIKLDPNYFRAYNNLGSLYYGMGRFEDSISAFEKVVEIMPEFSAGYKNLDIAKKTLEQYKK